MTFEASPGEIVGVAGVAGNGQSELMRALAGLEPSVGEIAIAGRALTHNDLLREAAYMPSDRLAEGLAGGLTVRENASMSALGSFASLGVVSRRREVEQVTTAFKSLAVKTASIELQVTVALRRQPAKGRAGASAAVEPRLIVADEPTQGVDVGARAEIYRILRDITERGTPVVINSSDATELEGLCDKVVVLSRGRVVDTLTGGDVAEARIVSAAVSAAHHVDARASRAGERGGEKRDGATSSRPTTRPPFRWRS